MDLCLKIVANSSQQSFWRIFKDYQLIASKPVNISCAVMHVFDIMHEDSLRNQKSTAYGFENVPPFFILLLDSLMLALVNGKSMVNAGEHSLSEKTS